MAPASGELSDLGSHSAPLSDTVQTTMSSLLAIATSTSSAPRAEAAAMRLLTMTRTMGR